MRGRELREVKISRLRLACACSGSREPQSMASSHTRDRVPPRDIASRATIARAFQLDTSIGAPSGADSLRSKQFKGVALDGVHVCVPQVGPTLSCPQPVATHGLFQRLRDRFCSNAG